MTTMTTTCLYEKVSEEDVIATVEKAEKLWEKALEAREMAEELSILAENFGEEAASSAKEAENDLQSLMMMKQNGKLFGQGEIENAQTAMNSSFDAGKALSDAFDATQEADRLEALAEEALNESEKALAQHLIDFPENKEE